MEPKCVNCGGREFTECIAYEGYYECTGCRFMIDLKGYKVPEKPLTIHAPEDPNDAVSCESCQ